MWSFLNRNAPSIESDSPSSSQQTSLKQAAGTIPGMYLPSSFVPTSQPVPGSPDFPKLLASYFCFARFNMFLLYYLRAWHRLLTANSPNPISRHFQGKKLISPLSLLTPPSPCPPHYYSLLINDRLYQSITTVKPHLDCDQGWFIHVFEVWICFLSLAT